ncbi:hypothetical protein [Mesorhizobium sp. M0011]|uniref:hypothetical protein n=1 Tax=Mesorhizobium sp. M0011 TaxID=2956839 RepID=UPI003336E7E7
MAAVETSDDEVAAGRAAADRLAHDWDDRDWIPEAPTAGWARAAITRLGEIIAAQPSILRASMKGAGRGASTLSPRPFQGIVECLQNADDLGASRLCVAYRSFPRPELLIVHDGSAVTLAHVGAMLLPWLSTKDGDPEASGRFGIGQRTLGSLGGPIAIHAPPFHFVMGDDGPEPCDPEADVAGVYDAARRDTMLVISLFPTVTSESVAEAVRELDVDALIFLKSIRSLQFRHLGDPSQDLEFSVDVKAAGKNTIAFVDEEATVELSEVHIIASADGPDARSYRRYSTRRTVRRGERRSNKATGDTTPIGICVPADGVRTLRLYDRMPLPVFTGLTIGLNAQFDPDSARSMLQPNKWNEARFVDLSRLVAWAALQAFTLDTAAAWSHVPLKTEADQGEGWTQTRIKELVASCHDELRERLAVSTGAGTTALSDLVYEDEELEPLLTEQDVERLRPDSVAMPQAGRDSDGRWRLVLDELGQSEGVGLVDALNVIDGDEGRSPGWYVTFAALAEANGLTREFVSRPGILLEDGTATVRPQQTDTWVLVKRGSPDALATRLKLARRIHPAYIEPESPASAFVGKLENLGVLFDDRDAEADVFAILGRGPATGADAAMTVRLEDGDLLALRDAWIQLPRDRHSALGPQIGRCVELKATWYGPDGRRECGWARPVEMYLPATIDREVDSFAKAAGRAPGLKWADSEYGRLLKHQAGRSAIGAQRLLAAWGVAREPRLVKPADERAFWTRDTTPASPVGPMQTADQLQAIRAAHRNTHLIEDHWSPDVDAVAADIAKAPVKTRRKRGIALLATLSRGWERRYSEAATAFPAFAYNGHWNRSPEVRATWLARLSDVKWMPDAGSGLQRPSDLQLQVLGNAPRPSERSTTIAKFDSQIQRSGILAALGVKAGPTQRDLVARLQALRKEPVSVAVTEEASATYQLLAASLRDRSEGVPEGRMSAAQLRNAFRAGSDGPGLLLVGRQWNSPEQVLRGPPIFGSRRAFAPHVDGLESLWKVLGVNLPTVADAIAVLKEMADAPPTPGDLGVAIRAITLVAGAVGDMSTQLRTTLRRLPLWTGREWTRGRPVYALEGEALLASAPADMRVWRPGLTSFTLLEPLLDSLGVVRLTPSDFRAASTPAYGMVEGEALRPTFSGAVSLLKQELVRADQALFDSLTVDWDELLAAPIVIDPELSIVATLASGQIALPARAHMGREPLRLIVKDAKDLATAEGAGAAVASLFAGDRQKSAWAWAAVWPRAMAGEQAEGAVLPKTHADRGDAKERLEKLAKQAAQRKGKTDKGEPKKGEQTKATRNQPVQVRKLRELDDLEPSVGMIVNEGAKPSGDLVFAKRRKTKERKFTTGNGNQEKTGSPPVRTVLPPSSDRERMALDAVRRALRLESQQLNDLRAARGFGVDAIDELRQCYEIKMSSSAGMPTEITLTASEVEAARNDPDFFLAIVSGLEDGAGELRVRFIFDPLGTLDVRIRSDLTLTGVDKAEALEFTFQKRRQEDAKV